VIFSYIVLRAPLDVRMLMRGGFRRET
jgi:hypothetical protein